MWRQTGERSDISQALVSVEIREELWTTVAAAGFGCASHCQQENGPCSPAWWINCAEPGQGYLPPTHKAPSSPYSPESHHVSLRPADHGGVTATGTQSASRA